LLLLNVTLFFNRIKANQYSVSGNKVY